LHEHDESLSSTSEDDQQESEVEESLHVTAKDTIPSARRGARLRSRSRQFNNTFKRATQTDRHRIKLLTIVEKGSLLRKYQVSSARDWLGYGPYTVSISKAPTCRCNDFVKSRTVKICKHIIWTYVVVLGVDIDANTLQQAALTEQEVQNIFDKAPPPPLLSQSPVTTPPTQPNQSQRRKTNNPSSASAESRASKVIEKDRRCQLPQVWRLERYIRKSGPKPQCAGCRKVTFDTGDTLLSFDTLYVPRDKDFCIQRTYRFCVESQCFSNIPKFSNLRPITNALAGNGVSQQDFEKAYSQGVTIE
jgi:hypothetical protein